MVKTCERCKKEREHYANGYCRSCYNAIRHGAGPYIVKTVWEHCNTCGVMFNATTGVKHYARGMCIKCYSKHYQKKHRVR